jgi:uncharacterized membrane protein/protein-disulfide isomerase
MRRRKPRLHVDSVGRRPVRFVFRVSTTRRTGVALLLLALLGLGASAAAAFVHYKLLSDVGYVSPCDISATWNCSQVYESQYGTFWGVPVAVGGVIWTAAVTLLALAGVITMGRGARAAELAARIPGYIFVLAVPGLAVVIYLGYASIVVLKTYCLFCLLTYVAVVGIFLVSGAAADESMTDLPRRAMRDLRLLVSSPMALVVSTLFVVGAIALVALFPRPVTAATRDAAAPAPVTLTMQQLSEFERWYTSLPRVPVAVPNDGAKVLIVKFNDYQCPPCRQTYEAYKPIIAKYQGQYPGKVKFVTKDYPLEPECNSNAPAGQHLAACEAAVAVRLARAKKRGEAMEEWLFQNQPQMTPDMVREGVKGVAGVTDFDAQYPSQLELVKGDIALGALLQVKGTPTFFVNGVRIPIVKPEFFDAVIAYELKH